MRSLSRTLGFIGEVAPHPNVAFHVSLFLSVHITLGFPFMPVSWDTPVTCQGVS